MIFLSQKVAGISMLNSRDTVLLKNPLKSGIPRALWNKEAATNVFKLGPDLLSISGQSSEMKYTMQ